jgi:hypothetical protein
MRNMAKSNRSSHKMFSTTFNPSKIYSNKNPILPPNKKLPPIRVNSLNSFSSNST